MFKGNMFEGNTFRRSGFKRSAFIRTRFTRAFRFLLLVGFATAALRAADNPFVGDWKLNLSQSKFTDVMKIESLGANKFGFDFGAGSSEKIAIDGSDQAGLAGTTLSVTVGGPDSWKVVRKKDGHILLTGIWKLSADNNTLTDNYTEFQPNGSPSTTMTYLYKRTAAGAGFAGNWEAPMAMDEAFVLQIRPYEGDGLSFIRSADDTRNVKFDGKDYPLADHNAAPGSTSSARRVDERTLEITDKTDGKVTRTIHIELSADLKTLTRTVHPAGQQGANVFVFERQ
jgi:hypothetical protein